MECIGIHSEHATAHKGEVMGYNTKHFDHESYYNSKTTNELEAKLKSTTEFIDKHPQFEDSWLSAYQQRLKVKIAERIGKKKLNKR